MFKIPVSEKDQRILTAFRAVTQASSLAEAYESAAKLTSCLAAAIWLQFCLLGFAFSYALSSLTYFYRRPSLFDLVFGVWPIVAVGVTLALSFAVYCFQDKAKQQIHQAGLDLIELMLAHERENVRRSRDQAEWALSQLDRNSQMIDTLTRLRDVLKV